MELTLEAYNNTDIILSKDRILINGYHDWMKCED